MVVSDAGRLPPAGVGGFVTDVTAAPPASAGGSRPASLATPRTLWPPERQKQPTKRARNAAGVAKEALAWPRRRWRGQRCASPCGPLAVDENGLRLPG